MIATISMITLNVTPHELAMIQSALVLRVEQHDATYRGATDDAAIQYHAQRLLACRALLERVRDARDIVGDAGDQLALHCAG